MLVALNAFALNLGSLAVSRPDGESLAVWSSEKRRLQARLGLANAKLRLC